MPNAADARRLLRSERRPGHNFDVFDGSAHIQSFADGISSALIGPAVCKLEFFQVSEMSQEAVSAPDYVEPRERTLTLTIPTAALLEFMGTMIFQLQSNQDQFAALAHENTQKIFQALNNGAK